MMILTVFRLVLLLSIASFVPTESLVCHDCKNISNTTSCRTITTCGQEESCFMDRITSGNTTLFTLGCTSNKDGYGVEPLARDYHKPGQFGQLQICSPTWDESVNLDKHLYSQCNTNAGSGTAIIGRSLTVRQDRRCHECCSTDICALQLCAHKAPTSCIDDETLDCPHLNTVLDLCSDVSHAKHVCPRFCGLCNIVDGKWSSWSTWTNCSVTCETGTQARTRTCTHPPPSHGGEDCVGHYTEIQKCVNDYCPVHGGWSDWLSWADCSTTCGVGIQRRFRDCTNPAPSIFGDQCTGVNVDDKLCFPGECSVDGKFSDWGTWSTCSVSCGNGSRTRNRTCEYTPFDAPKGQNCTGVNSQTTACPSNPCKAYMDCLEIKRSNTTAKSGLYNIHLPSIRTNVQVFCDMVMDGGGWTVFQNRYNGSVDFYRSFTEYEDGFGNINGEFWLGLKTIQELTSLGRSELRIDLTAADGSHVYELFQHFSLSPGRNYTLNIDRGTGTAGDTGTGLSSHNGCNFATKDNDDWYGCAKLDHGGWWYNVCAYVNLNGNYEVPGTTSSYGGGQGGVIYYQFKQHQSLKSTSMMLRRNK